MSQQRLTQCPHCKASFKVSEEQLGAANGRVRCGACMNIFDALAYSSSDANIQSSDASDIPGEAIDLEDSILQDSSDSETLFADNPEEDKHEAGYSGDKSLQEEFSTSFLELDNEPNNDLYSTSFQKIDEDLVANENSQSVDESWTQNILDDIQNEKDIEPSINDDSALLADPEDSHITSDTDFSDKIESNDHHYDKVEFHYQQDAQPGKRHWSLTLLFLITNMSLIVLLLAQAVWFHYEKLVKYPQVASIYELACAKLNCTLPELEDINKIKSNNLIVRSHPTRRRSLVIDTVIINKASFDQNFPDLALYFSDINKNVIAQRLIKPSEYLSGDLLTWEKMPQQQPIHISLEIVDPGKEAVNYSLKFFPNSL